jgi:uncharacterized protein YcsI (UPF0317 family)
LELTGHAECNAGIDDSSHIFVLVNNGIKIRLHLRPEDFVQLFLSVIPFLPAGSLQNLGLTA